MNNTLQQANKYLGTKYTTWDDLSCHKGLTEPFIEWFQDYVNWTFINQFQIVSKPFIEKFHDRGNWNLN